MNYRGLVRVLGAVVAWTLWQVTEVPPFSPEANALLDEIAERFTVEDALSVKKVGALTSLRHF
jgi:hypothetical protein